MPLNLQIINPITYPGWDELLLSNEDYSFFHSSSWASVLYKSYHYKPQYFTLVNENKLLVSIPVMEVKGFMTGKRGVSLPFTDYVDPIIAEGIHINEVFDILVKFGREAGWEYIEIRGGKGIFQDIAPSSFYCGHTLDLLQNEDQIFTNFRDSTKRNIKKSLREGIKVNVCNSLESINEFYRLNCMTRKMHGLPPQPYQFFKKIYDYVISKNHGLVALATHKGRAIAGAIYFHFGRKVIFKYGASNRRYQQLRPNNLVKWEAIKWYCRNGFKDFCFGKTEQEHDGLLQFKRGWGIKNHIIKYYKYDLRKNVFIKDNSLVSGYHNNILKKIPSPVMKIFSTIFYGNMG